VSPAPGLRVRPDTPPPGASGAAIAALCVTAGTGEAIDALLRALAARTVPPGHAALRNLGGIDRGVVARWTPTTAHLMPHGGREIVARLRERLADLGATVEPDDPADPTVRFPEASDTIEACALDAIHRAASPLAIDVLLRQRDLWRASARGEAIAPCTPADAAALDRLLAPPTVVLLGAPNIGKSTLTNTLAGRAVSIVADAPGTTRDHVGVTLDLDGLVVRWIDAPGIADAPSGAIDRAAASLALHAAARADLVLWCEDATAAALDPLDLGLHRARSIPVALRADLGVRAGFAGIRTAAARAEGTDELARAVRETLVPSATLASRRRWRFHPALPGGEPSS
jgi:tRNA modification GTPase